MNPYKEIISSPAYVLEEKHFIKNLELLKSITERADIDILLALKAFSLGQVFPTIIKYISGGAASSLHEARWIYEKMGVKAHTYCVAYSPADFEEIMTYSSHIIFNSLTQFSMFSPQLAASTSGISCGLRINPNYPNTKDDIHNPAALGSRLGETFDKLGATLPKGLEGLHFHTLYESNSHELAKMLKVIETACGNLLYDLKWINLGGGQLLTDKDYEIEHLIKLLKDFKAKYKIDIILEPGTAVVANAGSLVATVLDIFENSGTRTAILDISFANHIPDLQIFKSRPVILESEATGEHQYRMGGISCLAGDYLESYQFDHLLKIGDRLTFCNAMPYTMVKSTIFNGIKHPSIYLWTKDENLTLLKNYGYQDYKNHFS